MVVIAKINYGHYSKIKNGHYSKINSAIIVDRGFIAIR